VRREAHVDPLHGVPELRERGIEVEIDAAARLPEDRFVAQDTRHVDEHVGGSRRPDDLVVGRPHGVPRPAGEEQGRDVLEAEAANDRLEVRGVGRVGEGGALRPQRGGGHRIDEQDAMAEPAQPEDVLQNHPRPAAVAGDRGERAGEQDRQGRAWHGRPAQR